MKVSSTECALVISENTAMAICIVQHVSLGAFWYDTCISVQHNRKTGRGDGTRARYKPPHRTSWANNIVGGQTVLVVGRRDRVKASVILFDYDVHSSRKLNAGVTVNTFSSRRCSQANRSSRKHSRSSDFCCCCCYDSEVSLASSKMAANWFHLFTD